MKNLETSTKVISAILSSLLERGLKRGMLDENHLGVSAEEIGFVEPCFQWLADEGLVRWANTAHSMSSHTWIDPVLTSRGFALLGAKFEFDGEQVTVADVVSNQQKVGAHIVLSAIFWAVL